MRNISFFGGRLHSAARRDWQRPSRPLANAHVRKEPPKSTCALIASRYAAHHARDPERIQPEAGASTVALRGTDRLSPNEDGVLVVSTALSCIRTKTSLRLFLFPAELYGDIPRLQANGDRLEV
jgi:hypothetical protein